MSGSSSPAGRKRLLELDAFRGLASLGVLLYHYYYYYFQIIGDPADGIDVLHVGRYGVELFFLISGFVIFLSLERTRSIWDFVVSRFARLFPVYWFSILITSVVVHGFGLEARVDEYDVTSELASRAVGFVHTLGNLTMLEEYVGWPKVDGAYWTLTFELSFYFVAVVAFFTGLLKRFHLAALAALLALYAAWAVRHLGGVAIPFKVDTLLLLRYGHLFLLGMLLYRIWTGEGRPVTWLLMPPALGLHFLNHDSVTGGLVVVFVLLFLAFFRGWLGFLAVRPLLFLGAISYSLYIVHQYAGYVLIRELLDRGLPLRLVQVIACLAALLVATVMNYGVERPVARRIRTWWKGRRSEEEGTSS